VALEHVTWIFENTFDSEKIQAQNLTRDAIFLRQDYEAHSCDTVPELCLVDEVQFGLVGKATPKKNNKITRKFYQTMRYIIAHTKYTKATQGRGTFVPALT